jgi:hypothetical protein
MAMWVFALLLALSTLALPQPMTAPAADPESSGPIWAELLAQMGGSTWAVAVQGGYAYVGIGPRLTVLYAADPAHSTLVGQTDVLPAVVKGVVVAGGYAYVADAESGLRVVDVMDPAAPFGPSSPKISPRATRNDTPRTAWLSPYDFCRSSTTRIGSAISSSL